MIPVWVNVFQVPAVAHAGDFLCVDMEGHLVPVTPEQIRANLDYGLAMLEGQCLVCPYHHEHETPCVTVDVGVDCGVPRQWRVAVARRDLLCPDVAGAGADNIPKVIRVGMAPD